MSQFGDLIEQTKQMARKGCAREFYKLLEQAEAIKPLSPFLRRDLQRMLKNQKRRAGCVYRKLKRTKEAIRQAREREQRQNRGRRRRRRNKAKRKVRRGAAYRKRRLAALKGWRTRRKRRLAALKGWRTRRRKNRKRRKR